MKTSLGKEFCVRVAYATPYTKHGIQHTALSLYDWCDRRLYFIRRIWRVFYVPFVGHMIRPVNSYIFAEIS